MNRRPFVVFSILYVCGIIISDKIYNKEYIDIFEFLIIGTFMACLWNYKFVSNDSCIDKDKRNYNEFVNKLIYHLKFYNYQILLLHPMQ